MKMMKKMFFSKTLILFHVCILVFVLQVLSVEESEKNSSPMKETEKQALYSAIQGFVGKWWNGSELYPDPCGWTPIQGVSCDIFDGIWYVTSINIGFIHDSSLGCTTNAEFRSHFFELNHLKTLSFVNCFIYSHPHSISIPNINWEKLSQTLESLEFRSNPGLIGEIPPSFCDLTKLQSLVLLQNGLSGELPVNLGNLVSLKRLVLAGNKFTGQIPISLGGLSELLIFDSSRNSLNGPIPLTFGGLTSLLKLDLSNNMLHGMLPYQLGKLKNLTLLDLRSNKFSGGLVKSIEEMVSLEELVLSNNPICGDLNVVKWENLQNLVSLDLSYMGLTGEIIESISELRKLRYLGLNNNNLQGNVPLKLGALSCITTLYLHNNNLTGKLEFSEWFYGKMGRRFGAWKNRNLCYPVELMSTGHVPFGIQSCDEDEDEVSLLETNSKTMMSDHKLQNHKYDLLVSMGFSICDVDRAAWVVLRRCIVVIVVISGFIL